MYWADWRGKDRRSGLCYYYQCQTGRGCAEPLATHLYGHKYHPAHGGAEHGDARAASRHAEGEYADCIKVMVPSGRGGRVER